MTLPISPTICVLVDEMHGIKIEGHKNMQSRHERGSTSGKNKEREQRMGLRRVVQFKPSTPNH